MVEHHGHTSRVRERVTVHPTEADASERGLPRSAADRPGWPVQTEPADGHEYSVAAPAGVV
ncbi:MAG: hypothetical protein L0Y54_13925, partial [Sporichthyaceae bacterium]|nr:hypothetical protein [Sporichthyaceae bacterium]